MKACQHFAAGCVLRHPDLCDLVKQFSNFVLVAAQGRTQFAMPQLLVEVLVRDGLFTVTGIAGVIETGTIRIPTNVSTGSGAIDPGKSFIDAFTAIEVNDMKVGNLGTGLCQRDGQQSSTLITNTAGGREISLVV